MKAYFMAIEKGDGEKLEVEIVEDDQEYLAFNIKRSDGQRVLGFVVERTEVLRALFAMMGVINEDSRTGVTFRLVGHK